MWSDFQMDLRARYSGGRRGGGTLAKGAAVAWGAYQVEVFFSSGGSFFLQVEVLLVETSVAGAALLHDPLPPHLVGLQV